MKLLAKSLFFDKVVAIFGNKYGSFSPKFCGEFLVAGPLNKVLFCGFPKEAVPLRLLLYLFPLVRPDYAILGISIQEVNIGILIDLAAPALIYRETVTQDFLQEVGWN